MTLKRHIRLTSQDVGYLKSAAYLDSDLKTLLSKAIQDRSGHYELEVSVDDTERFRGTFTERLASVGFDADYKTTAEGKILESLIDKFYCCNDGA